MQSFFNAKNISKEFDDFKLDNISFEVLPGMIVGLIGKNASGKSTLLRALMGTFEDENYNVILEGIKLSTDEKAYKQKIAYVLNESPFVSNYMSPISIGKYYGRYYGSFDQNRYQELLESYGIINSNKNKLKDKRGINFLSTGEKIKLQLAFALSYDASIYFLDEPTGNLDVEFRDEFYKSVREIVANENKSVIYASHLVEEMENFADYILWLRETERESRVFFYGTIDELRDSYRIIEANQTIIDRLPAELIVGGRLRANHKEILIRYDSSLLDEQNIERLKECMRYPTLKEIMYYVEKQEVICHD